ncbi:hypothetical protein DFH09DRAFT_1368319 [Mycena vulgaris]|nr:hypothetical protein DFH09DRAFT_1368319 [Mycena vulgaris]
MWSVEGAETAALATLERAEGLWDPEGNLIIHAEAVLFRVSRWMLTKQSPVLEEMLAPFKITTYDTFDDGCPVLHVSFGSAETAHFLAAIFDPDSFNHLLRHISFDAIAAVLRLSTAYQISGLRQTALIHLSSKYPTTLADFSRTGLSPSYCRDQILPVIQLAREHAVDWILPLAFYCFCLGMTGRTLMSGVDYGVVLGVADQTICYDANSAMRAERASAILARYETRLGDEGCTGGEPCRRSRFREADTLLHSINSVLDLFRRWEPEAGSNLCGACLADMRQWHVNQMQAGWDGLPAMFGLPDWTILNQLKEATLGGLDDEDDVTF